MMMRVWIGGLIAAACGSVSSHSFMNPGNSIVIKGYSRAGGGYAPHQNLARRSVMMSNPQNTSELMLLEDNEIITELRGKTISPDFTISQASLDFSEQFLPDGGWISIRKMRGPVQRTGRWFVKDRKICVEKLNDKTECRSVWKSTSGHLYIKDLGASPPFDEVIRIIIR